jgi:hypothetical protein
VHSWADETAFFGTLMVSLACRIGNRVSLTRSGLSSGIALFVAHTQCTQIPSDPLQVQENASSAASPALISESLTRSDTVMPTPLG